MVRGPHESRTSEGQNQSSTRVEGKVQDQYVLHGDFTLKGMTKQISIPFTMTGVIKEAQGNTCFGVAAQKTIATMVYLRMLNGGGGVGSEVMIDLQLEAMKTASNPTAE